MGKWCEDLGRQRRAVSGGKKGIIYTHTHTHTHTHTELSLIMELDELDLLRRKWFRRELMSYK
jgi:hypothetical protein